MQNVPSTAYSDRELLHTVYGACSLLRSFSGQYVTLSFSWWCRILWRWLVWQRRVTNQKRRSTQSYDFPWSSQRLYIGSIFLSYILYFNVKLKQIENISVNTLQKFNWNEDGLSVTKTSWMCYTTKPESSFPNILTIQPTCKFRSQRHLHTATWRTSLNVLSSQPTWKLLSQRSVHLAYLKVPLSTSSPLSLSESSFLNIQSIQPTWKFCSQRHPHPAYLKVPLSTSCPLSLPESSSLNILSTQPNVDVFHQQWTKRHPFTHCPVHHSFVKHLMTGLQHTAQTWQ